MSGAVREQTQSITGLSIRVLDQGTTIVIELDGELDLSARHILLQTISDAFAGRPACVQLDLHQLTFIDSTGVHAAQEARRLAVQTGVALALVPAAPSVQRVFELAGMGRELPFVMSGTTPPSAHGSGSSEVEALPVVNPELQQDVDRRLVGDVLGDDLGVESVRHVDDRSDDQLVGG
jgi:anti-sigma B factor antagonist